MNIKTKLTLGVGLLFSLIVLLILVGARYTHALKQDTENILVANYNSLEYAKNILIALDQSSVESYQAIEKNLYQQEKNLTETGEGEATKELRIQFDALKKEPENVKVQNNIRKEAYAIMDMNMKAIQQKSERAKITADKALFWIAITGSLCFLIAFVLLINLPSNIADPIKELSASIKQIADKKYTERVHFQNRNEFGELANSFNTMAAKLEEYNNSNLAKLMMEKKRIETLIHHMRDPVIGLDQHLTILFVNEKACNIIGLNQKELEGKLLSDLAKSNDLIRTLLPDLQSEKTLSGKAAAMKIYTDNKEGYFEKEIHHITITPTGETQSVLIGHVILLKNITEYKELDFAKTNFIATVSHEFKTPIASMNLSIQLLENEQIGMLNAEQKNLLNSLREETARLLKITSELLNLTQVETGNIQLNILAAHPLEIVSYALQATHLQAEQKNIHIQLNYPEQVPDILADTEKTAWVLTNLLANAIRYSFEHSEIIISMQVQENQLVLSVKDSGRGIDSKYLNKIFDRYFKVPGSQKEGTGLGLAISKEFIEAQHGNIRVSSEIGSGSTFSLYLNLA